MVEEKYLEIQKPAKKLVEPKKKVKALKDHSIQTSIEKV